jgi:cation:H+ antiporter
LASPLTYLLILVGGLVLMVISSNKTIDHAVELASAFGIPHFLIGFLLIALGTDLPEIVNSILASYLGHAEINVGDSMGSVLSQLTLIFGILPFIGGVIKIKRRESSIIGCCLLLALIIVYSIFEKGSYTRLDAFFLLCSWALFAIITSTIVEKENFNIQAQAGDRRKRIINIFIILIGMAGIGLGSYLVVESVIFLSKGLQIPEFFISFFIVGIGTSLPELVVDITAIRKKHFDLAVGDILGSCLVDATFSIGIGHFIFPHAVATSLFNRLILYTLVVTFFAILMISVRKRVDRKAGFVLIMFYLFSFTFMFIK